MGIKRENRSPSYVLVFDTGSGFVLKMFVQMDKVGSSCPSTQKDWKLSVFGADPDG